MTFSALLLLEQRNQEEMEKIVPWLEKIWGKKIYINKKKGVSLEWIILQLRVFRPEDAKQSESRSECQL